MNQKDKQIIMQNEEIKLLSPHNGDVICVLDEVSINLTYSALLMGDPASPTIKNELLYGSITNDQFSRRPLALIGDYGADDDGTVLPSHTIVLYLISDITLMDDQAHGSHLKVKMLMDFDFSKSILSQIQPFFSEINWHRLARDFYL